MSELDEAYKAAEMLMELGLPIDTEKIENIWRLERENGVNQREDLNFYFYDKCFNYYTKRIMDIRQAKIRGEVIVAKPVLLLAIIDGIGSNVFSKNEFPLTEWLQSRYNMLMQKYMRNSQFDKPTDISNPYWHLQSDGFWNLRTIAEIQEGISPSKAWLKENVDYAYFDEALWIMLQNKVWRMKLRDYIIEHKLTDDHWRGKIAAEGLGIIAAIILAA